MRVLSHCTAQRVPTSGALRPLGLYGALCEHTQYALTSALQALKPGEFKLTDTTRDPHKYRKFSNKLSTRTLDSANSTAWKKSSSKSSLTSNPQRRAWKKKNKFSTCWDLLVVVGHHLLKISRKKAFHIEIQHLQVYKLKRGGTLKDEGT